MFESLNDEGYSVIELMMVTAIVGMLSIMSVCTYQDIAKQVRISLTRSQIQEVINIIQARRTLEPAVLNQMTGNQWTCQGFDTVHKMNTQPTAMAQNDVSWNNLLGGSSGAPLDAWGQPLTIDENEQNNGVNDCRYDVIMSGGPDEILNGLAGSDDDVWLIVPHQNCTWGPVPETSGATF